MAYKYSSPKFKVKRFTNIIRSIPEFCFPDADIIEPVEFMERYFLFCILLNSSCTYSFVLTDIDGSRRIGYCLRILENGTGKRLPVTYCLISAQ